jgi:hypothetical protein
MGVRDLKTYAVAGQRKRRLNRVLQVLRRTCDETEKKKFPTEFRKDLEYEMKLWVDFFRILAGFGLGTDGYGYCELQKRRY